MENQEPLLISEESVVSKEKKNPKTELIMFLILGFLLGIVIKTEAGKRITMGYEDYRITAPGQMYDISKIQKKLSDEKARDNEEVAPDSETAPAGGACGI